MQTWERLRRRCGGHPMAAAWRMVIVLGVVAFVAVTLTGGAAAASATHTGVASSSVYAPLRCGVNGGAQPSSGQYVRQSADGSGFVYASRPLVLRGFTFYPAVWAVVGRYGVYAAAPAASIPSSAPSPAPVPISSVPCTVTVIVGGQPAPESGTCSGTFQLGKG